MIRLYGIQNGSLSAIPAKRLAREDDLQRWIAENPQLIGLNLLVIGREISTGFGRIDILAMNEDGGMVVVECKRDQTPREVIAQLLDYGSWVSRLDTKQIYDLYASRTSVSLQNAFKEKFEVDIPDALNNSHDLIVVASEFDASSRRIVEYLATVHKLSINAVFFSTFSHHNDDLLAIEWLLDQQEVTERAESKISAPWEGFYYVNVGESEHRHWEDMREVGFLSAGGDPKYSGPLQRLSVGDIVVAYQKKQATLAAEL